MMQYPNLGEEVILTADSGFGFTVCANNLELSVDYDYTNSMTVDLNHVTYRFYEAQQDKLIEVKDDERFSKFKKFAALLAQSMVGNFSEIKTTDFAYCFDMKSIGYSPLQVHISHLVYTHPVCYVKLNKHHEIVEFATAMAFPLAGVRRKLYTYYGVLDNKIIFFRQSLDKPYVYKELVD